MFTWGFRKQPYFVIYYHPNHVEHPALNKQDERTKGLNRNYTVFLSPTGWHQMPAEYSIHKHAVPEENIMRFKTAQEASRMAKRRGLNKYGLFKTSWEEEVSEKEKPKQANQEENALKPPKRSRKRPYSEGISQDDKEAKKSLGQRSEETKDEDEGKTKEEALHDAHIAAIIETKGRKVSHRRAKKVLG